MRYLLGVALLMGCSSETTTPAPVPIPAPEPTATASLDAGASPLLLQPPCATWAEARPFRAYPMIGAWYAAPCPYGMEVRICASESSPDLPDNAVWFDGHPYGLSPACVPDADTVPLTCTVDADCPSSGAECWRPYCNYNIIGGQCMQTWAGLLGQPCGSGGVCRIGGMLRSEVDGLLISEQGWPAVCDVPQWPE